MPKTTQIPVSVLEKHVENATGFVLTEGAVIVVNAQRFSAMLRAGLLARIPNGNGGTHYGFEHDYDDMITCVIAELEEA